MRIASRSCQERHAGRERHDCHCWSTMCVINVVPQQRVFLNVSEIYLLPSGETSGTDFTGSAPSEETRNWQRLSRSIHATHADDIEALTSGQEGWTGLYADEQAIVARTIARPACASAGRYHHALHAGSIRPPCEH